MSEKSQAHPVMQDLGDPASLISRAFARLEPPQGEFEPGGEWVHEYRDISSLSFKHVQGAVTLRHLPGRRLRIVGYKIGPDRFRYYTRAEIRCDEDDWSTPSSWRVESKVARGASEKAYLNSGLEKAAVVRNGMFVLQEGESRREVKLAGRYTCKWCLLHAVGLLARADVRRRDFTLIDEYDELCPNQTIEWRGTTKAMTRSGPIEVSCYQHTGTATMPGVFYVDGVGRPLFYLAGMQLLALSAVDGKKTGL